MKDINIEEAASWSDEEAAENLAWLRDRPWRYDEVNRILELRGGEPDPPAGEGDPEQPSGFDFNSTKKEVLEWVGDDAERAEQALEAEQSKGDDARVTLVEALEELATS